jgi:hypothetical protein
MFYVIVLEVNMTNKQKENYNKMLSTLKRIAKGYDSSDKIIRNSEKDYGLDAQEALEYAYDNLQHEAKSCIKGIRSITL